MNFWLVQAIGLLGSLLVIGSVQFNSRKVILAAQAVASVLWLVHYGCLGATTAVFTNFISLARSVVFYNNSKPWAKSRAWPWLFVVLLSLNSVFTWEGLRSLLPACAMICTTFALWSDNTRRMRALYLLNSPFWLSYNIISRSYSCAITEMTALVSYAIAVWRYDIRKQPEGSESEKC